MTLWLATALTSILLAVLAQMDRWRADWIPSATESWLNLLITAAWACLAAWTVFDRRYNKWLVVLFAIHVPALLADVYILSAHGFPILPNLPGLFLKQALFFGAITLPSIAVASVVRGFKEFLLALAAVLLCMAVLNGGGFQSSPSFAVEHHEIRDTAIRLVLVLSAAVTIALKSRGIALAGAVAALALAAWLPARVEYTVQAAASPEISRRPAQPGDAAIAQKFGSTRRAVLVPIAIADTPRDQQFRISKVTVMVASPKLELTGFIFPSSPESKDYWLAIQFPPSQPKPVHFSVYGTASFDFYRSGETVPLAQAKHCSSATVEDRPSDRLLKVFCETPNKLQPALVTLRDPSSGRDWRAGMNSSRTYAPGPHEVWLSPLFRSQAFFHLTASDAASPGAAWLVPAAAVPSGQIEITPEVPTGRALAEFSIPDISPNP